MNPEEVPRLDGWLTTSEAGRMLGTDKAGVWKAIFESGMFMTVRKVGEKPLYLIAEDEVKAVVAQRENNRRRRLDAAQRRETRKEIRSWAKENGLKVGTTGMLSNEVRKAFSLAHPGGPDHSNGKVQLEESPAPPLV